MKQLYGQRAQYFSFFPTDDKIHHNCSEISEAREVWVSTFGNIQILTVASISAMSVFSSGHEAKFGLKEFYFLNK